jgi:hypothetical protein
MTYLWLSQSFLILVSKSTVILQPASLLSPLLSSLHLRCLQPFIVLAPIGYPIAWRDDSIEFALASGPSWSCKGLGISAMKVECWTGRWSRIRGRGYSFCLLLLCVSWMLCSELLSELWGWVFCWRHWKCRWHNVLGVALGRWFFLQHWTGKGFLFGWWIDKGEVAVALRGRDGSGGAFTYLPYSLQTYFSIIDVTNTPLLSILSAL